MYEGEFKAGKAQGQGKYISYLNGAQYTSQFVDAKPEGKGRM